MATAAPVSSVRPLTPKQAAFVREYQIDQNGQQAAMRAGCPAASAKVTASRWLRLANVQQALANVMSRAIARAQVASALEDAAGSAAWIVAEAVRVVRETETPKDRVPALALLAKRHPEFRDQVIDQSQHLHLPEGTTLDDLRALRDGLRA